MPGDPLTFWLVFFQLTAGVVLLFRRQEPRTPVRLLAAMLLLNAGVSAIWFQSFWPPWDPGRRIAAALDAPTEALALAFLASLWAGRGAQRATQAFIGLAVVLAVVAPFMYPDPSTPLSRGFELFRQALYFVGLALVSFRLAGGHATWERWAALAFLPRALYWGTTGSFVISDVLAVGGSYKDFLSLFTVPFLVAVSAGAYLRLLRGPRPPAVLAVVLIPLTGVAIAVAEVAVRRLQPVDPILVPVLSLLTLGLHRPLFLLVGLAPGMLGAVAARATVCAVVGSLALAGLVTFYPGATGAAILTGFVSGAMALAVLEVLWPRLETWDSGATGARPSRGFPFPEGSSLFRPSGAASAPKDVAVPDLASAVPDAAASADATTRVTTVPVKAPRRGSDRPQWQSLLLSLAGSALEETASPRGEARLTQKSVVERTGISAPRVSTLVRELNATAEDRLDSFVPGWRETVPRPLSPQLVHQLRGSIAGMPGVWVYYRLTPLGERLAAALAREIGDGARGLAPSPPDAARHASAEAAPTAPTVREARHD